jgi:hypothetical protein
MRGWPEPADLPLLLFQTKHNWSLAPAQAHVDSAKHDIAVKCGGGEKPKLDLIRTYTRLWFCGYMRRWPEPADLPLLLSQTKHNWSLAPAQAHVDSGRDVFVVQCGGGDKPILDLIRTYTRLWCCGYMRRWPEPADLPLLLFQTKHNWSLAPAQAHVDSGRDRDLIRTYTRLWFCGYMRRWPGPADLPLRYYPKQFLIGH